MGFSEAAKGLRVTFYGELLQMLSLLVMAVLSILIPDKNAFLIAEGIFLVLNTVLIVSGLIIAGKEEKQFKSAWLLMLSIFFAKGFIVVISFFSKTLFGNTTILFSVLSIFEFLVILNVIQGIKNLYQKQGNTDQGYGLLNLTVVTFFLITLYRLGTVVIALLNEQAIQFSFLNISEAHWISALTLVFAIANIIGYLMYMISLYKASKRFWVE